MQIGTDVSIPECRRSGYPVLSYKKSELYPKSLNRIDVGATFNITISNPECWTKSGRMKENADKPYKLDIDLTWREVLEIYQENKHNLDKYMDFENCPIDMQNPTPLEIATVVGGIDSYLGFDYGDYED